MSITDSIPICLDMLFRFKILTMKRVYNRVAHFLKRRKIKIKKAVY